MNIRARLSKLEAVTTANKPLMEMSTEELELFIRKELELSTDVAITDDMLWEVACMPGVTFSKLTHEETLELLK